MQREAAQQLMETSVRENNLGGAQRAAGKKEILDILENYANNKEKEDVGHAARR